MRTGQSDRSGFSLRRAAVCDTLGCMKSPLLALLLIVNLLTCPVRCLSCEAKVATGEACAQVACSCCPHDTESPVSDDVPEPCGDDCGCQNCICEGAVVETAAQLLDSMEHFIAWVRLPASCSGADVTSFYTRRFVVLPGQFLSGRAARIAYQSWLI